MKSEPEPAPLFSGRTVLQFTRRFALRISRLRPLSSGSSEPSRPTALVAAKSR